MGLTLLRNCDTLKTSMPINVGKLNGSTKGEVNG